MHSVQHSIISAPNGTKVLKDLVADKLTTVIAEDDGFDTLVIDYSDPETLTFSQTDEHGVEHVIVMSPQQVAQCAPYYLLWKSLYQPKPEKTAVEIP